MTLDEYFALPGSPARESPVRRAMLQILKFYPELSPEEAHQFAIPLTAMALEMMGLTGRKEAVN